MSSVVAANSEIGEDHGVQELFRDKYNSSPELIVRCPGRVNLIGKYFNLF